MARRFRGATGADFRTVTVVEAGELPLRIVVGDNALSRSIDFPPSEKLGLLEASSVLERYERLSHLLRFRLAVTETEEPSGWKN